MNGGKSLCVDPADRGLAYGDGVFETIAIRNGQPRLLKYHLDRLQRSCEQLGFSSPQRDLLVEELSALSRGELHAVGKIIVTRGAGPRGYRPPQRLRPTRVIGVEATSPKRNGAARNGIRVRSCSTRLGCNPALAGIKTLNRLEQVLARAEWSDPEIAEGLMQNLAGDVIGGTMSNLFAVIDGGIRTPALDECGVRGVMRQFVLETARELCIDTAETRLTVDILRSAQELFLTNSQFGIWPVVEWEGTSYAVGPCTRQLLEALAQRGIEECAG